MSHEESAVRDRTEATLRAENEELRARLAALERKAAEQARATAQLDALLKQAPIGFAYLDRDWRYERINERLAELHGLPVAAHLGRTVAQVVPWRLPMVEDVTARILATGEPVLDREFSGETRTDPGVTRSWLESWYPVRDSRGEIEGFGVLVEEITERKRAEATLHEAVEGLRLAAHAANLGAFVWDLQTGVNVWTPELEALYGLAPGEFGRTQPAWEHLVHHDDRAAAVAAVQQALASGTPVEHEWRVVWRDGSVHWILGRFQAHVDAAGTPLRLVGVNLDITARKQAVEALEATEQRLRAFLENSNVIAWLKDEQGRYLFLSDNYQRRFGVRLADWLGKTDVELWPREAAELYRRNDAAVLAADAPIEATEFTVDSDGKKTWWLNHKFTVRDAAGRRYVGGLGVDITERRRAEEQLSRELDAMTRLQRLGTLFPVQGRLEPVLLEVVDTAVAIAGADFGNLQLLDAASGDLRIAAQRGFPRWWLDFWDSVAANQGACGTALERGERIIVEDVEQSPIFAGTPALDIQLRADVRAVQSTPLLGRSGRPLGILSTHYRAPHRPDDRTLQRLDLLGRQAAGIIDREQARAALSEQQAILESFYDSAPFLMGVSELHGDRIVAVSGNRAMAEFVRSQPEELPGRTSQELGTPAEIDEIWRRHYRLAERDRAPVHFDYQHPRLGGAIWLSATVCYIGRTAAGRPRFSFVAEDVTRRKQQEGALRESEARFRSMANGAPVIIWLTDASGQIEFVNREYREYFGVTLEQVVASHDWQAVVHADDRAYVEAYSAAVRNGSAFRAEARIRRADGEWRWISSHGSPRLSDGGEFVGHVGCSYDITDAKRLRAMEEEAARQKDQFIAILAHELRNPLAPIRTSVALLRAKGPSEPMLMRCRDVIDRQAAHMSRLLDDLLDVSRLSRGTLTLQRAPMILREAVDAAIELARPLVEQQQHTLTLRWSAGSVVLEADSARLTQAIGNLLLNAAKYTPGGGTIDLSVRREDGDVVIAVRDSGVGIEADSLQTIFDLFARGDHAPAQGAGGLGIGLALARRLVEMHGGTLRAASPGRERGSEFVVRLPGNDIVEGDVAAETPLPQDEAWRGRRVLVVDDNVDSAEMLGQVFDHLGAMVRTVHDGEAAWRAAAEFAADLVLLDLGMPWPDGYEVCRRIRRQPWGRRTIIVALTGWGQEDDRRRTQEAGFSAHILKPVDPAVLLERLRSIQSTIT